MQNNDADRKGFEHHVVSFERRRVLVPGPIRLENDLRNFTVVRPASGNSFRAFRSGSMEKDHVRVLRANLVESRPEALGFGAGQSSSAPAWEGASRSKTLAMMSVV